MRESDSWEHDEVVTRLGRRSGVPITVAVHSRALGPAVGGTRLRHYPHWRDGLADALRLSTGMTYKCAAAGLPFGGGKSVLAVPAGTPVTVALRKALLADLGELIETFEGTYLTGPDVGTGPADMVTLRQWTPHAFCLPEEHGGTGSSSGPTAAGVLAALRAGARSVFGTASMAGRRAVVIGMGNVGSLLADALAAAGAEVVVSDVDASRGAGYRWAEPDAALNLETDVLIPAAVGGVFGPSTVVNAPLVVGPANNQLTENTVADRLAGQGTVWIPDFVASAGGVVYTLSREFSGLDHTAASARVEEIETTTSDLLTAAGEAGTTPLHEAMELVRRRLAHGSLALAEG
jgi:valine dehydrogenase (NAD+)